MFHNSCDLFFLLVPSQEQAEYDLIEKRIRSDRTQVHLQNIKYKQTLLLHYQFDGETPSNNWEGDQC